MSEIKNSQPTVRFNLYFVFIFKALMCSRVSGSVGPGAMLQPHVCYIDMVGWQLTAVWPGSSCCQLSAAAWQRLSSAPCPPTSCAPAAETDGDPRHHNPRPRAEGNICCDQTIQPPAASSLAMFSDFWEEDLYKVSSISIPATSLLTFMALLGISVDEMSGYLTASENSIKCFLRTVKLTVVVNNRRGRLEGCCSFILH